MSFGVTAQASDPQKALDPFDAQFNWKPTSGPEDVDNQAYLDTDEYGHAGAPNHLARIKK